MMRRALLFTGPRAVAVIDEPLPPVPPDHVVVRSALSAVSAGTELLIYRGQAPATLAADTTIAALAGDLAFPLRYGYALVGRVAACGAAVDPAWHDRLVFAFHPHASHAVVTPEALLPVPDGVPAEAAALLPNVETAVSLVMDGTPVIGERVAVLGQGVVGLLTTGLLGRIPLTTLLTVDGLEKRRRVAAEWGATVTAAPDDLGGRLGQFDLVYELTGDPAALNLAIDLCGFGGRIVVGSWYGTKSAPLALGGAFHRNHLQLITTQVSTLAPRWHARWTKARRLAVAWEMVRRLRPEQLITDRIPFAAAPAAYARLDADSAETLQLIFSYELEGGARGGS